MEGNVKKRKRKEKTERKRKRVTREVAIKGLGERLGVPQENPNG
jgi:hypothetical protein